MRRAIDAIELKQTVGLNSQAEGGVWSATANVVLRTIGVEVAWNATVHATAVLACEAEHAIEVGIAARRRFDAALALLWNVHALAAARTHRAARASTAASEHAFLERRTLEVVAARFDAHGADRAIVIGLARTVRRTRATENTGGALRDGPSGASHAPNASRSPNATRAAIATNTGIAAGVSCPSIRAARSKRRCEQHHSKPSISHEGLLNDNFTEIFRYSKP
jgi:hypothetical protein